jgi:chitin synthase
VDSLASYHDRPDHRRADSYNSIASGEGSPEAGSPLDVAQGELVLTIPQAASMGNQNRLSRRSPLARVSLIRTESNDGSAIELQGQHQQSQSPRNSPRQSPRTQTSPRE